MSDILKKKRGLVFISKGIELNRFLLSGSLDKLKAHYKLKFIFSNSGGSERFSKNLLESLGVEFDTIKVSNERHESWQEFHDLNAFKFEKLGSYGVRSKMLRNQVEGDHKFNKRSINFYKFSLNNIFDYLKTIIKQMLYNFRVVREFKKYVLNLESIIRNNKYLEFKENLIKHLGDNDQLLKKIKDYNPDFIVFPTGLYDSIFFDLLMACNKLKLKCFLLQAGWDNLAGKYKMIFEPSLVFVWGEQSKNHAIKYHGIHESKIKIVGAPHYDPILKIKKSEKLNNEKFILFAGLSRQTDEIKLLLSLDHAITDNRLPKVNIIYRPHPNRMPRKNELNFFDIKWMHVEMDRSVEKIYNNKINNNGPNMFKMNDLFEYYKSVDVIITPMSTLALESTVVGIPVVAYAGKDSNNKWGADQILMYDHFKEYRKEKKLINWAFNKEELIIALSNALSQSNDETLKSELNNFSKYFVFQDDIKYSEKIFNIINDELID